MTRAAAAALVLLVLAGCGTKEKADGGHSGPLAWDGELYRGAPSKMLPRDQVVLGRIKNASLREVRVHYKDVRLLDPEGQPVLAGVRFTHTPGHGLYSPGREPPGVKESEDLRIGRAIRLRPGATAPVFVSWRQRDGGPAPVVLDYRFGRLRLPPAQ